MRHGFLESRARKDKVRAHFGYAFMWLAVAVLIEWIMIAKEASWWVYHLLAAAALGGAIWKLFCGWQSYQQKG